MEDYIFLIIAVVISIFAAINKNRKAKMEDLPLEEEEALESERRNRFMDELLGEDFLEEDEAPKPQPMRVQPLPKPAIVKAKENMDVRSGLDYKRPRFKSTLPERIKRPSIASAPRQKEDLELLVEEEETSAYLEDFSLRKAVVYSIILEPRYEA